ncbi:hypothetical protein [Pseudomonas sp. TTU2014-080ASC]|uniref:hypothetical protein n=1 Tax=Pseudomonas sp. TTU2014-080ASC TaxID=1729724 RepID=UPI00072C4AED|nr:hypothetical protein [Pseudomonas sp. TTU2014-080ASC]KRW57796.1 hypothetical protein AO726_19235 [Pseudomonas sp. TTU2014-080ASC]
MTKKKQKKTKHPATGICALLSTEGPYAKSHLIPLALTSPEQKGSKFIEAGRGMRPIRRPTSWYDSELCTHAGELILRDIDNHGISILRKHKLIWNSWPPKKSSIAFEDYVAPPNPALMNFRRFQLAEKDATRLKIFYLSILWRFLSSKRPEFSYLENIGIDLNELTGHIRAQTAPGKGLYLICLHQHVTRGFTHNHSPTIQEMEIEKGEASVKIRFYRIYFNGLVAHLYPRTEPGLEHMGTEASIYIGEANDLVVFTRPFEQSRQETESIHEIMDTVRLWPAESIRIGV